MKQIDAASLPFEYGHNAPNTNDTPLTSPPPTILVDLDIIWPEPFDASLLPSNILADANARPNIIKSPKVRVGEAVATRCMIVMVSRELLIEND